MFSGCNNGCVSQNHPVDRSRFSSWHCLFPNAVLTRVCFVNSQGRTTGRSVPRQRRELLGSGRRRPAEARGAGRGLPPGQRRRRRRRTAHLHPGRVQPLREVHPVSTAVCIHAHRPSQRNVPKAKHRLIQGGGGSKDDHVDEPVM